MKLPNGYGSVFKMSGKRRKPYAALLTTEYTETSQTRRYLGAYRTRTEAMAALADFHKSPFNLDASRETFASVYAQWVRSVGDKLPNYAPSCFRRLASLHDLRMVDIRRRHIQAVIDADDAGPVTKNKLKVLVSKVFRYAIDGELVTANMAQGVRVPSAPHSTIHQPLTDDELATLWTHTADLGARVLLTLCYTGMRPVELCLIKRSNVHLAARYMVGGVKTAAGIDRVIPIAERIVPFIELWLADGGEYLFTPAGDEARYGSRSSERDKNRLTNAILALFARSPVLSSLPTRHLPHDGRHTCATRMDNAGVNHHIAMAILGHAQSDITSQVYTHKTVAQLVDAINQI